MLTFLRKIRKSLINSGAITRYLFYAFGEIVLVVVGIIIALQLNNWNESRKFSETEKEYLEALQDEFEENINILKDNIETNERVKQGMRNMLTLTGKSPPLTSDSLFPLYHNQVMREIPNYEPTEAVLDDLISSGNLSKISNIELRRSISKAKAYLNKVNRQEVTIREARSEVRKLISEKGLLRPFLAGGLNIEDGTFDISPNILLTDPRFENYLTYCLRYNTSLTKMYANMEEFIFEIKDLIIQQLEN